MTDLTPERLADAAREAAARWPGAVLMPNQVGNLAILHEDRYVGWLDLTTGEVHAV